MAANSNKTRNNSTESETVEVLYQKLGNRWFAFSLIDEEVFVGSISQEEIDSTTEIHAHPKAAGSIVGNS